MPIRKENKDLYPDDWPEIRAQVQKRAGDRCEGCGVHNHSVGYRDQLGTFREFVNAPVGHQFPTITIVCTTAHLDHNPENNDLVNLRFWCQQCHNQYDAQKRADGIKRRNREAMTDAGQGDLL